MLVAHFLGTMRPDHDGVTRVMYKMRGMFSPRVKNVFVSPQVMVPTPEDMKKVPSVPFFLNEGYRLSIARPSQIRELLKDHKPDIVHIHTPCTMGLAAVRYAGLQGIPVVATYHTHFPTYFRYYKVGWLEPGLWRYFRWLYGRCASVIVPSKATLRELEQAGLTRLVSIPHGVEMEKFSPDHRSEAWREKVGGKDRVIVTFVSRLVWEKNLKVLADAVPLLKTRDKVKFVIVGDGPARKELEALMPDAYFTGFLNDQHLPTAYASSDVFVFPSITETFGNVIVEAMASGLPAVCASRGGACDSVEAGVNGFLVDDCSAQGFAGYIDRIVGDADLRKRMSLAALKSARAYRWELAVERYETLYKSVLTSQVPLHLGAQPLALTRKPLDL